MVDEIILKNIATELECGFEVYLHRDTMEIIALPDEDQIKDLAKEFFSDDLKRIRRERKKFLKFDPPSSRESFWIMQAFIREVDDKGLQSRLEFAIQKRSPFANFKTEIDNSGPYRERWFQFRTSKFIEWAREQWEAQLAKGR